MNKRIYVTARGPRTSEAYFPAWEENQTNDKRKTFDVNVGTISATTTVLVGVVSDNIQVLAAYYSVTTAITTSSSNYYDVDLQNLSLLPARSLFSATGEGADFTSIAANSKVSAGTLKTGSDDVYLKNGDVLGFVFTKASSGADHVGTLLVVEYKVTDLTTSTSSTSTTTTTTTTTTVSTTTTTTTISTSTTMT